MIAGALSAVERRRNVRRGRSRDRCDSDRHDK